MLNGPRPLVLFGPSGSGKSTLLNKLLRDYPEAFGFSVSHTTRKPRPKEVDGKHYHFTTKEKMEADIKAGKFIESATFSGNMYGTSKSAVEDVQKCGKICILDIDVQGVKQVKQTDLNPYLVFIKPPSIDELKKRLEKRNTESKESLQLRLDTALKEMEYGSQPGNFDVVIINENLDHAYKHLKEFIESKVLKKSL